MAEEKEKAVTTESVVKSQARYTGNTHFDLVEVEFVKDSSFYKKGQKDEVHPSVAEMYLEKGIISKEFKPVKR